MIAPVAAAWPPGCRRCGSSARAARPRRTPPLRRRTRAPTSPECASRWRVHLQLLLNRRDQNSGHSIGVA